MTAHSPRAAGELANDSMSRHDGPTLEDTEAGMRAGETVPNQKTAGGARGLLLSWLELTKWVETDA